jgi:hypothetical protein
MAVITITEILGGDNIAGSRITINDNFKRLTNAINTIETRLDTSFTPGGSLNVGNALIKKYTNPITAQIFTCEATGQFQGNLNVSNDLGVTKSVTAGLDLTVSRNVLFDGSAVGGGSLLSQVRTTFENEIVNQQLNAGIAVAPTVDPQALTGPGTTRAIPSVENHSVLSLDLSQYLTVVANDCDTVQLPVGTAGQILTVIIDTISTNPGGVFSGFAIDTTVNFDPAYAATNLVIGAASDINNSDILKLAVTLYYSSTGWRVLNVAQPSGVADITY